MIHPLQTTLAQPGIVSVRVGLSYDPLRFSPLLFDVFPFIFFLHAGEDHLFINMEFFNIVFINILTLKSFENYIVSN